MTQTSTSRLGPFGHALPALNPTAPAEVADVVAGARAQQRHWAERPVAERAEVLLRLHDLVLDRHSEILDLLQQETGKSRVDAYEEVVDIAAVARHYARRAARYLQPTRYPGLLPGLIGATVHRDPRGVVGVIAPWNYPLVLTLGEILPALMAGNAVVVKPDPLTPQICRVGLDLLSEAGLPSGLVAQVDGGADVGQALIEQVDHIVFTGSIEAGRAVAQQAAGRLIGATLELGGKNGCYVRPDADLALAVPGAVRGTFANAGQLCLSIERLVLHRAVADAFLERFLPAVRGLKLGNTLDFGYQTGSLISARQLERVQGHLADAVERGAMVAVGGEAVPELGPYVFSPTVLLDVPRSAQCYREETFGPLVSVFVVDSDEAACDLINDTEAGLTASIWTRDGATGRALARRLEVGSVSLNENYAAVWGSTAAPFGGVKQSGVGRRHGPAAIRELTTTQLLIEQRAARLGLGLSSLQGLPDQRWTGLYTGWLRAARRLGLS